MAFCSAKLIVIQWMQAGIVKVSKFPFGNKVSLVVRVFLELLSTERRKCDWNVLFLKSRVGCS